MTWEKCFFNKILVDTFRLSKKLKHAENKKGIQSKVGLTGHRQQKNSSPRNAEKESDWVTFHCKIEQTTTKAATEVVNKKLHWGINIQRTL